MKNYVFGDENMALSEEIVLHINNYCNNHLPDSEWYNSELDFIEDEDLRNRIIREFKSIRFAYKLYEGIAAKDENLIFEVRHQILSYASLYEAILDYVLIKYYKDTEAYNDFINFKILKQYSIPTDKLNKLKSILEHDGKDIVPCYYAKSKREYSKIKFKEKCNLANKLGIIYDFYNQSGEKVNFVEELKEIYSYRNAIHIIAEKKKNVDYDLELSKKAYRRIQPFLMQIREKLRQDRFL